MNLSLLMSVSFLFFCSSFTLAGQVTNRTIPFELVGVNTAKEDEITLEEVVELALRNNRGIEVERINTELSQFGVKSAQGQYDPNFSFGPSFRSLTIPVGSVLGGGPNGAVSDDYYAFSTSLRQLLPTGGNFAVSFDNQRQTTNNIFTSLNPQYDTRLSLNFAQPLFRNLKMDSARHQIRIAKKQISLSDAQFRFKVMEIVTAVVQSYWNLAYTYRDLEVKRETAQWALDQLESNKRLAAAGALPQVQIVESEAELQRREGDVLVAMQGINLAQNILKQLILPDRENPLWKESLKPKYKIERKPFSMELPVALQKALAARPELEQINLQQEINAIDVAYNQSQVKPQLDLLASYLSTGLAGAFFDQPNFFTAQSELVLKRLNELSNLAGLPPVQPIPQGSLPTNLIGGYGSSLNNLFLQRYRTVQAGVTLSFPIRNRTAEANLASSLVTGRQIRTLRQQMEQVIEADVRNSLQAVLTAQKRVETAAAERQASQAQLESEQRRFRAGETINFFVLTRQNQLSEAKSRELRALADYIIAKAQFHRATATILEEYSIQLGK